MLVLGVICLLVAAALVVGILATGTSQEIVFTSTFGDTTTRPVWVFVAGVVTTLLVLLGLSFFGKGTSRRWSRRREFKRLRKVEQEHVAATEQAATEQAATEPAEPTRPATGTSAGATRPVDVDPHDRPS